MKKTLRGWFDYLDDPKRELTAEEFKMLMLFNIREYARLTMDLVKEQKEATEHLEGMMGSLDTMLTENTPNYPQRKALNGRTNPADARRMGILPS